MCRVVQIKETRQGTAAAVKTGTAQGGGGQVGQGGASRRLPGELQTLWPPSGSLSVYLAPVATALRCSSSAHVVINFTAGETDTSS